ncbi:MAG: DUF512 domain-containing protein [Lachnospiraceae bacterium]|nr:DUF512 domain-containing protein [Lachnospiraceae bacterium]
MAVKRYEHIISYVEPYSIADEMEIEVGDLLLSINKQPIEDVFDYRYLIKDEFVDVLIRKASGEEWELEIEKDYDDDLGIEFENSLMSEYRSCRNKCIFCFIDQMPPGMRETLYFKDDDSRLSFLQGNYITLTNMEDKDVDRIVKMQLAPINISIQTTNPTLRCKMLNNRFAGDKLRFLDKLYEGHVEMNGQIVCCKGVNDKDELRRSIEDLKKYLPFMKSVSVVPAGVTKYREGLFEIKPFTKEEACETIDLIERYQQECFDEFGLHFIHASDEWYILAERDFPEEDRYDGYIQLENGVGMMRLLKEEFDEGISSAKNLLEEDKLPVTKRTITMATGKLAYSTIYSFAQKIMEVFSNIIINVVCIRNDFFGESITVSGLITGQDLIKQIKEQIDSGKDMGDTLIIPCNMLRMGENVFLDDYTTDDVEKALSMHLVPVENNGKAIIEAAINDKYNYEVDNGNFVYIKAYQ